MKDYLGYEGKSCVVTGAASGMGKVCAEALVELGAKVYAVDLNPVSTLGIEAFVKMDLGNRESIDEAFKQLPETIDKFFGFAGFYNENATSQAIITVNFVGSQYIMREYLSNRVPAGGAILLVTSIGANRWYVPENRVELEALVNAKSWDEAQKVLDVICVDLPVGNAYTFSKRALQYFATKTSIEMAAKDVRVNTIKPGNTKTGLYAQFLKRYLRLNPGKTEKDYIMAHNVTERAAEPFEMAEPAIYLNSKRASFISGVELVIDYAGDSEYMTGVKKDIWVGSKLTHMYEEK